MTNRYLHHQNLPSIVEFIRSRINKTPEVGIVLGSGLGALAEEVEVEASLPFADIPGYVTTGIPGHEGRLIFGNLAGKQVALFSGRVHYYEGHSMAAVTLSVQTLYALNARGLILSCSVGGLNPLHQPGDFMLVNDHINFQGTNPLYEMTVDCNRSPFADERSPFVDMCGTYRDDMYPILRDIATERKATLHKGTLCCVKGPNYETPAEVRMFQTLGADAVCMSTVPEAIVAKYLGLETSALSMITNAAHSQITQGPTHHEVLDVSKKAAPTFVSLMKKLIEVF